MRDPLGLGTRDPAYPLQPNGALVDGRLLDADGIAPPEVVAQPKQSEGRGNGISRKREGAGL